MGRPGLPPGMYFRLLLIGYFEGLRFGVRHHEDPRNPDAAVDDQQTIKNGDDSLGSAHDNAANYTFIRLARVSMRQCPVDPLLEPIAL
jgi:hypothetical protein